MVSSNVCLRRYRVSKRRTVSVSSAVDSFQEIDVRHLFPRGSGGTCSLVSFFLLRGAVRVVSRWIRRHLAIFFKTGVNEIYQYLYYHSEKLFRIPVFSLGLCSSCKVVAEALPGSRTAPQRVAAVGRTAGCILIS